MTQKTYTKSRFVISPAQLLSRNLVYTKSGGIVSVGSQIDTLWNTSGSYEVLESTSHRGPPFKEGGPFRVTRSEVLRSSPYPVNYDRTKNNWFFGTGRSSFIGGIAPKLNWDSGPPLLLSESYLKGLYDSSSFSLSDLTSYGPTAINRFSPLSPGASLGQFLVEGYRDGLPQLPLRLFAKLKDFRSLGHEYLNVEFGWIPFVNDLRKLYATYETLNQRLGQIIRDNNRPVRRKGVISHKIDSVENGKSSVRQEGFNLPYGWSPNFDEIEDIEYFKDVKRTQTSEDIWFAGRFRYFIPDVTDNRWTRKAKLALFGANPTPSLLYQVMPWSWLIDWFSNVGDVIANSSSNGIADLTIDYGYLMRHHRKDVVYDSRLLPFYIDPFGTDATREDYHAGSWLRTIVRTESKERVVASPFGFGLQIDDLSARQLAILAALGLTRQNFLL